MAEKRGFDVTISSTTDRVSFEGNGVASSFSLPFRFFSNSDIQASLIDAVTGEVTALTLGVDYSLQGAGAPEQAGSPESVITMVVAPAVGKTLFVQRVMEIVQPTDIVNQGRFFPEVHETVFDRLTMLVQQAALGPSRTIRVPESDPIPGRLPSADARATKVFGFDENGDPVVSSLSLSAIEGQVPLAQGFAQASAASASEASGYAEDADLSAQASAASAVQSGEFRDEAEAIADSLTGAAVPLFSVMWWPSRAIPEGYVAADGQTLPRATYPDAWAGIQAGNVPTVADATWNSTPTERGKFTAGDGSTTFRLPDYNGKFAGSLGAVFLRGDGALSAAIAGVIQRDAMQGHKHRTVPGTNAGSTSYDPDFTLDPTATPGGGAFSSVGTLAKFASTSPVTDGANGTPRTASETRPLNVTGCWVIKLFGAVVNVGSADAAQLASDYANLVSRTTTLENIGKPFTKEFVSTPQIITAGGLLTIAHGLGVKPKLYKAYLVCITVGGNWAVNDEVFIDLDFEQSSASPTIFGMTVKRDATNLIVRFAQNGIFITDANTGAYITLGNTNFRIVFEAWA